MDAAFERTALMLGEEALHTLQAARVAVFGVGGVGGYVCEALARSGIGALDLIDNDVVSETNLNRQILALHSTLGQPKTEVAKARLLDINPHLQVRTHPIFFTEETADLFDFSDYAYVVDAIDTVCGKVELVLRCASAQVPIISSMGAGNKLHPELFEVADIYETSVCPLARVMRAQMRRHGIAHLKVVYSKEKPRTPAETLTQDGRHLPGSTAFTPSAAGLVLAGAVVRDLLGLEATL